MVVPLIFGKMAKDLLDGELWKEEMQYRPVAGRICRRVCDRAGGLYLDDSACQSRSVKVVCLVLLCRRCDRAGVVSDSIPIARVDHAATFSYVPA